MPFYHKIINNYIAVLKKHWYKVRSIFIIFLLHR